MLVHAAVHGVRVLDACAGEAGLGAGGRFGGQQCSGQHARAVACRGGLLVDPGPARARPLLKHGGVVALTQQLTQHGQPGRARANHRLSRRPGSARPGGPAERAKPGSHAPHASRTRAARSRCSSASLLRRACTRRAWSSGRAGRSQICGSAQPSSAAPRSGRTNVLFTSKALRSGYVTLLDAQEIADKLRGDPLYTSLATMVRALGQQSRQHCCTEVARRQPRACSRAPSAATPLAPQQSRVCPPVPGAVLSPALPMRPPLTRRLCQQRCGREPRRARRGTVMAQAAAVVRTLPHASSMYPGPRMRSAGARAAGHREGGAAGVGAGVAPARRYRRGQRVRRRCKPGRARRRRSAAGARAEPSAAARRRVRGRFERRIREAQNAICAAVEAEDGGGRFREDAWCRPGGGGGVSRVLQVPAGPSSRAASVGRPRRWLWGRPSAPASVPGGALRGAARGRPPPVSRRRGGRSQALRTRDRPRPGQGRLAAAGLSQGAGTERRATAQGPRHVHRGPGARAGRRGVGEGGRGRVGGVRHHAARGVPRGARRGRRQVALRQRGARPPRPRPLGTGRAAAGAGPALHGSGRAAVLPEAACAARQFRRRELGRPGAPRAPLPHALRSGGKAAPAA